MSDKPPLPFWRCDMRFLVLLVFLLVGCTESRMVFWWVEDATTAERIGPFVSQQEANNWITKWKQEREEYNKAEPAEKSNQPPQTISGNGFVIEVESTLFQKYRFDRDLRVVREENGNDD